MAKSAHESTIDFIRRQVIELPNQFIAGFGLPDLIFTVEVGKCEDVLFGE